LCYSYLVVPDTACHRCHSTCNRESVCQSRYSLSLCDLTGRLPARCVVPFECSSAGIDLVRIPCNFKLKPGDGRPSLQQIAWIAARRPFPNTFRWGLPGLPSLRSPGCEATWFGALLLRVRVSESADISGSSIRLALISVLRSSVKNFCELELYPRHAEIFWRLALGLGSSSPSFGGSTSVQYISAVFGLFMYPLALARSGLLSIALIEVEASLSRADSDVHFKLYHC
jgi:hypothetical protein